MNILINAYAVAPNWGSEQGMGWNWVINLAKYCNVYVITEGEWKEEIECALHEAKTNGKNTTGTLTSEQAERLHFYYNPVPEKVRKICWNQGDWRFYYYYKKWQDSTLKIACEIIKNVDIDIVHQLNMIGYREPGMLWKIDNKPFVWGPFGGCELMPEAYVKEESLKYRFAVWLKNKLNTWQRLHQHRFLKALNRADGICNATKGVNDFVRKYHRSDAVLINETGCYIKSDETTTDIDDNHGDEFNIMWVGKFDFRKQLGLALKTMALLKNKVNVKLHVLGDGSDIDTKRYHSLCDELGINDMIVWHGKIPNKEVQNMMGKSDLLLFTSIMEGTPHVIMEALGNNLPTICFDTCGQGDCINDSCGIKIPLSTPDQSIKDFANAIQFLCKNMDKLYELKKNCHRRQFELCWDERIKAMLSVYDSAIKHFNQK